MHQQLTRLEQSANLDNMHSFVVLDRHHKVQWWRCCRLCRNWQ